VAVEGAVAPPRFRIYPCRGSGELVPVPHGTKLAVETARLDGSSQKFAFEARDRYWEATAPLPEPHEFLAIVKMTHGDHSHTYRLNFSKSGVPQGAGILLPSGEPARSVNRELIIDGVDTPAHSHSHAILEDLDPLSAEYQDAHERAHAEDLRERFANRRVTTWQVFLFGLTGGLMPCPAAFTILLVCLQLKRFTLGMTLVLAFSVGLALTLVTVGAVAALSLKYATKKFEGIGKYARWMPYGSSALMGTIGLVIVMQGIWGLTSGHVHGH
jgi:nickel/cobalt exporter